MSAASPFTDEQQKFLLALLQDLQDSLRDIEAAQNDLGCDFIALKEVLVEKSLVTDDELCVRREKMEDLGKAVVIAKQNKQFFEELRQRLEGKE